MMQSLWETAKLPPEITGKLNEIIRRVRLIQLARGLLATIGVAIACALVTMAVDAALAIYNDGIRLAISLAGLVLTLLTAFVALVRPLADKITPVRMARIIETRHPELQERISSALELLAFGGGEAKAGSKQLLQLLVTDARTDVSALSAQKEFKGATMKPVAITAGIFIAVLLVLFAIKPHQTKLLFTRAVAPCARLNNLGAMRFSFTPGDIIIVQGESVHFTLVAPGEDSTRAELCIKRNGEPLSVERMTRRFDPNGGAPVFELVMPSVTESFTYRMRIGKAITSSATITAVPPPAHGEITCTLIRPEYTGLGTTQLTDSAEMPLRAPVGTKARVETDLNREMSSLLLLGDRRTVSPSGDQPSVHADFSWSFATNSASKWAISLKDARGFTNVLSWASYEVIPDYPADIRLTYPTGSSYTLPTYGYLKTVFELRDDYGISSVELFMQPDNDKTPWTIELPFEKTGRNLWTVTREISLSEFMISGAKKLRIWLEAKDNFPSYLGGPNVTRSRVIAVNLDNAERRSLADQVRIPERDAITNLLEQAALRLEEAAGKLAAATNAPSATEFEKAVEIASEATHDAEEKTEDAQKTAAEGLFAGVAEDLKQIADEALEKAGEAVAELPLAEEEKREQIIREAIDSMNKAAEEARAIVPEVLEKDAVLEKAATLEELSTRESEQARKAQERQLTDAELDAWSAKQEELIEAFNYQGLGEDVRATASPEALEHEGRPDAQQPNNPTAQTPNSPNAQTPNSPNAQTPNSPDAQQPDSPAAQVPNSPDAQQPDSPAAQTPNSPDAQQPNSPDAQQPINAAKAAIKSAEEAKAQDKNEAFLQQARTAETAAKESRHAAKESQRAKNALGSIEKDRQALEEISKAATAAKAEANEVADDAFQVKLQTLKREIEQVPPDIAKANELAKKASNIAALADKFASNAQDAPSAEKLEALAQELATEAATLEDSPDPFLKKTAEMAKKVADACRNTIAEPPPDSKTTNAQQQKEFTKVAEDVVKAAENAAKSPREQAFGAIAEANAAAVSATNLSARLDAAFNPNPDSGSSTPAVPSPEEKLAELNKISEDAAALAQEAHEAAEDASAAEKNARSQGANLAANAAQKAKQTAETAENAANATKEAANRAAEELMTAQASENSTPEFKPPQVAIGKQGEARYLSSESAKRSAENESNAQKLSDSPAAHAAKAAEAARKASDLSSAIAKAMEESYCAESTNAQTTSVQQQEKLKAELSEAIDTAREEARAAIDTAGDTRENFPKDAAVAAIQAADNAEQARKAYDAATAEPQPGQPQPDRKQLAQQANGGAERAALFSENAEHLAELAQENPQEHMNGLEEAKSESEKLLEKIADDIIEATKSIQDAKPIASTNAVAADAIAAANGILENSIAEAATADKGLQKLQGELPAITANADRIAKAERASLDKQGRSTEETGATPSELAATEARQVAPKLAADRRFAQDLQNAARNAASNPNFATTTAKRVKEALSQLQPAPATTEEQGTSSHTEGDRGLSPVSLQNATQETRDLATQLTEAQELLSEARDAFAVGDAEQAHEVATSAQAAINDVAQKAAESEAGRKASADTAMKNSQAASKKASDAAGKLLADTAAYGASQNSEATSVQQQGYETLSGIASNILSAATLAADSPAEAIKLADRAIGDAMKLQAPSKEQLEAARQANLAAQELKRMAMETAELAGLDPETMKIKKPDDYNGQKEKPKYPNRQKKPARTKVEGGDPQNKPDDKTTDDEYEDGITLQMPEWLRRLGFPRSEWLKYKGSLESGLPDSALEHVPQEYRGLVREYFKLLSTEK